MPFLEEHEWEQIQPLLTGAIQAIKDYRQNHGCDIAEARRNVKPEAMLKFEELTGKSGVHYDVIYHHRLKNWGEECPTCGYLLRTPEAKMCVNCGWRKEKSA